MTPIVPLLLSALPLAAPTASKTTMPSTGTSAPAAEAAPQNGRLPRDTAPVRQRIDLDIDPRAPEYRGRVVIDVELAAARRTLWLHARDLVVDAATIRTGGQAQDARFAIVDDVDGVASLTVARPLPPGRASIDITFHAAFRDDLQGIYRVTATGKDGVVDSYVFTQFEALSAREAFPCFDEPGWKIPFTVSVTHPTADKAIGNTRTVASEETMDGRVTDRFAETKPLPTYLLALVVGPVDVVDGPVLPPAFDRAQPLPVRAITVRGRGPEVAMTLEDTARVLLDQEQAFGVGYPYDKLDSVAVPDFAAGAMENAGLVTYRDALLFVNDESPIAARKGSLHVIAHEQAHQWFGNLVTMGWWDDLWLNEAFATWFAARTVQRLRPDFDGALDLRETGHWAMDEDSLVSARRIREPIQNRGDIQNAFDGITYSKGAAVIAMFEEYIDFAKGSGTFLRGVKAYLQAHRFGSGSTADFLAAISAAAGFDVAPAFSKFLDRPGVPLVRARCAAGEEGTPTATMIFDSERFLPIGSTGDKKKQWDIPVCVSFLQKNRPQKRCTILQGGAGRLDLGVPSCPKAVHPNADGGGYYRFTMPAAELKALSAAASTMTAGERLALGSAVRGAFVTASVPFQDALAAALPLATDVEVSVALTPLPLLQFARDKVLTTKAARAKVNARIGRTWQPGLNKLGLVARPKDTPRDRERRAALFELLVQAEQAPLPIAIAAGREIFATGTTSRVAPDLWAASLAAAVEHGHVDAATWNSWLAAAKAQTDPRVRGWMLRALASTKNPALAAAALQLVFDPALKVSEAPIGIWVQAGDDDTRDGAFAFVTARWDEITQRLPEDWRPSLASAFAGACSEDDAARIEAFFGPKRTDIPGLDRALSQTVEEIRLCVARKAAHASSIGAAFGEKGPPSR